MTTAKARHLQKIFEQKYGAIGVVASMYFSAGHSIEFMHPTRHGPVHILARKHGVILAIDVVDAPGFVKLEAVKALLEKAKLLRAKPILALYSDGPKLSDEVYKFCKDNGIRIRRIRPG